MRWILALSLFVFTVSCNHAADPWLTFEGKDGPGKGKHVVLVSGDEEYRSEEMLPQMAKLLSTHHGFKCTVLFAIDPKTGCIDPGIKNNIPGLEALKTADLMVLFIRFRDLPDEQMKHIKDYVDAGKPIVAFRTATHSFAISNKQSPYYAWHWSGQGGGFGRNFLGETWVAHHGSHGKEGTRGMLAKDQVAHPILTGLKDGDIFGPSDVYTVKLPLGGNAKPLVYGQVTDSLKPDSKPVAGKKNDPMMPIAWVRSYETDGGKSARVFCSTMGNGEDFLSTGFRRLCVNACYWCAGLDKDIKPDSNITLVGKYEPLPFKAGQHRKNVKPEDLK